MLLPSVIIALAIFALDQLSKLLVLQYMTPLHPIQLLPMLDINLAHNHGAAFGIFSDGSGWQRWLFVGAAIFISVVILVWSRRLTRKDWWDTLAIGMIMGGAWGNMLDRVRFGSVTDFIDFHVGNWHWYMFNIADVGICIGAIMLIIGTLRRT